MIQEEDEPKGDGLPPIVELAAQYAMVRELGRGGTAVVYLAHDRELGRDVAIKVIRPGFSTDTDAVARLAREAKLVARLRHPNIVTLLGTHRMLDGSLALVMQYVPGPTLKHAIREGGPASLERVKRVLGDLGRALDHAHREHGIVHRDLKPENVYLDDAHETVLLSDFGIARAAASDSEITLAGTTLGTPAYMSPEQVDGGVLDGRSDLYSLGLIAYEMLTGRQPWDGSSLYSIIYKQKHEELPPLADLRPDIPDDLLRVIDGLLRKAPAERWPDAATFLTQLQAVTLTKGAPRSRATPRTATRPPPTSEPQDDTPTIRFRHGEPGAPLGGPPAGGRPTQRVERPSGAPHASPPGAGGRTSHGAARGAATGVGRAPAQTAPSAGLPQGSPGGAAASAQTPLAGGARAGSPAGAPTGGGSAPGGSPARGDAGPPRREPTPPWGAGHIGAPSVTGPEGVAAAPPWPARPRLRIWMPAAAALVLLTSVLIAQPWQRADSGIAGEPPALAGDASGDAPDNDDDGVDPMALGPTPLARPTRLLAFAGDGQQAAAGATLPLPFAVRVEDETGAPVRGVAVSFDVVEGGGAVHSTNALTDDLGLAMSTFTLGNVAGEQRVIARLSSGASDPVPFRAVALMRPPGALVAITPTRLDGTPGATLRDAVALRVEDAAGVPVAGVEVEFTVTGGGGRVVPGRVTSGADGVARTAWTLGPQTGEHALVAEVPSAGLVLALVANATFGLQPSPSVHAGGTHSCRLASDGVVSCWGSNINGQLGADARGQRLVATPLAGTTRFAALATGVSHTCALSLEGEAYCWGGSGRGQLGDAGRGDRSAPTRVATDLRFSAIGAGLAHTCSLAVGGAAWCWGANGDGQLGDGGREDRAGVVRVAGSLTFSALAVGWNHSCALTGAGAAYCWGENGSGQLGDGTTGGRQAPTRVTGDRAFLAIDAGATHSCGVARDGTTLCWGSNRFGQLGDGTSTDHPSPVPVQSTQRFVAVTAGANHTCALTDAGAALCWGQNDFGQLGDGTNTATRVPVQVEGALRFSHLRASGSHTCGRTVSGEEHCWGYNVEGQLGDGTRTHRSRPVQVGGR